MKSAQLTVCAECHVLGGWTPKWRRTIRELKLTCKMSGFRSQKGHGQSRLWLQRNLAHFKRAGGLRSRRSGGSRKEKYYNAPVSSLRVGAGRILWLSFREICWVEMFPESHLPVLVSTMIALAQHLKEASTAPIATDSVGSRVKWERRRSSSNTCLWNMAASASRAIWINENRLQWLSDCRYTASLSCGSKDQS